METPAPRRTRRVDSRRAGTYIACMALDPVRKTRLRIAGLVVAVTGSFAAAAAVARFILSVARNEVAGGRRLTRIPEYYVQIGAHYASGFTAGFFLCYSLMLFAVITGSWVDEILKRRRARAVAERDVQAPD